MDSTPPPASLRELGLFPTRISIAHNFVVLSDPKNVTSTIVSAFEILPTSHTREVGLEVSVGRPTQSSAMENTHLQARRR